MMTRMMVTMMMTAMKMMLVIAIAGENLAQLTGSPIPESLSRRTCCHERHPGP